MMTDRSSVASIAARFCHTPEARYRLDREETCALVRRLIGAGTPETSVARLLAWSVTDVRRAATPESAR
jgi:L-rhamnose isomerase